MLISKHLVLYFIDFNSSAAKLNRVWNYLVFFHFLQSTFSPTFIFTHLTNLNLLNLDQQIKCSCHLITKQNMSISFFSKTTNAVLSLSFKASNASSPPEMHSKDEHNYLEQDINLYISFKLSLADQMMH